MGGGDLWTELPCNAISGITGNFTVPKLLIEYQGCGLNASGPGINRLKLLFRGAEHGMFIQANHETIPKLKAPLIEDGWCLTLGLLCNYLGDCERELYQNLGLK